MQRGPSARLKQISQSVIFSLTSRIASRERVRVLGGGAQDVEGEPLRGAVADPRAASTSSVTSRWRRRGEQRLPLASAAARGAVARRRRRAGRRGTAAAAAAEAAHAQPSASSALIGSKPPSPPAPPSLRCCSSSA